MPPQPCTAIKNIFFAFPPLHSSPSNWTCSMPAPSGSFTSTPACSRTSLRSTPVHSELLMAPQLHPNPFTGFTFVMSSRRFPAHWMAVTTFT